MECQNPSRLLKFILDTMEQKKKTALYGENSVELLILTAYEVCVVNRSRCEREMGTDRNSEELAKTREMFEHFGVNAGYYSVLNQVLKDMPAQMTDTLILRVRLSESVRQYGDDSGLHAHQLIRKLFEYPTDKMKMVAKRLAASRMDGQQEKEKDQQVRAFLEFSARSAAGGPEGKSADRNPLDVKMIDMDTSDTKTEDESGAVKGTDGGRRSGLSSLTKQVKQLQKTLSLEIFGQDHAINTFVSGYFQSQVMNAGGDRDKPAAVFLFAGPSGSGKTFLAERAAAVLDLPFARFDMSEYATRWHVDQFTGTGASFTGAKEGLVTAFVEKNPKCLLLFDEIEKADESIILLFLQILDAGRLKDTYTNREVSFKDCIVIMTTNAGRSLYEDGRHPNLSGVSRKVIMKALREDADPATGMPMFPAAICSRFASGNVVMFNHMEAQHLSRIVEQRLKKSADVIRDHYGIEVTIDEDVPVALLYSEGGAADARSVGGRAERFINTELFELFRLLSSEDSAYDMDKIAGIHFSVEMPAGRNEISELFGVSEKQDVLVVASPQALESVPDETVLCRVFKAEDGLAARKIIGEQEIRTVFIEPAADKDCVNKYYLNMEDITSTYVDFYYDLREADPAMPVYVIQTEDTKLSEEEIVSFIGTGSRGICYFDRQDLAQEMDKVSAHVHRQRCMKELEIYHKVLEFGSAQYVTGGGTMAQIRLIGLKLRRALEGGDGKAVLSEAEKPDVHFEDVIGAEDAKEELLFFARQMKNPRKFRRGLLKAPKGVLLYGPPGTGKTMLAKAFAAEAGMTFLPAEGGRFLKKYVGEGQKAVHELFRTARKYAPSVLFIDEVDAIAMPRTAEDEHHTAAILNAFLTEMDGFDGGRSDGVFVLAATNFEIEGEDGLDEAFVRRFDRKILVDLPDEEERKTFLRRRTADERVYAITESVVENIAKRSVGLSLADLNQVVELAIRDTFRKGEEKVSDEVLDEAFETQRYGSRTKWDEDLMLRVARHEVGHAFISALSGEMPSYLTIVSRGDFGGYTQQDMDEGHQLFTKSEMLSRIRSLLGGRAAEIVYYGEEDGISSGVADDLEYATALAGYMLLKLGMYETPGLVTMDERALYGEMAEEVHGWINDILQQQLDEAVELIGENRPVCDRLVEELMKKNHLDEGQIRRILG